MDELDFYYWDVFPKSIIQSYRWNEVEIQLSVRGNPRGEIEFDSADSDVAWVDDEGKLHCGWQEGATVIMAIDSGNTNSIRYIQVEITEAGQEMS